jgi:hypothetical protein
MPDAFDSGQSPPLDRRLHCVLLRLAPSTPCQSFHRQPTTKVRGASPEITIDRPAAGRTQVALIESYA